MPSMSDGVIVCVPVGPDGEVAHGWGRAPAVATATVSDGEVRDWQVHEVRWDEAHDSGTEGSHHARIARFLQDGKVQHVVAGHMGEPMQRMLSSMHLGVTLGASGDARTAVLSAVSQQH